jgi:hypothetical protein
LAAAEAPRDDTLPPTAAASAQHEPTANFSLSWQAPNVCPNTAAISADTLRLIGEPKTAHRLNAVAQVTTLGPERWELDLSVELDGTPGERHLSAESCAALGEAAAVMFALMLNPNASVEADASKNPLKDEAVGSAVKVLGELSAGAGFGILPLADPQLSVGLGLGLGHAMLLLNASAGSTHDLELGDGAGGARVRWLGVGVRGCWTLSSGQVRIAPCLTSTINRLSGRGRDVTDPLDGAISWLGLGAAVQSSVALTERLFLYMLLRAERPLARPKIFLQDLGQIQRPAELSVQATLGVMVRVW